MAPAQDEAIPTRSRTRRRWARNAVALLLAAVLVAPFSRFLFLGNFGVVAPGRLYRSAQPKGDLGRTIADYRLASVLNLRGGTTADWWYADEVRVTRAHGVTFYDLPLLADRRPTRRELRALLDLFDRCRYPLLIHCKSGSDRTGLACALYELYVRGAPPERAERAFSIRYGHVPLFGPERLHEPIAEYAAWLRARGLAHTPAQFRSWVESTYGSDDGPDGPYAPLEPGPRPQDAATARRHRGT